MALKKNFSNKSKKAQSIIEYVLLLSVALILLWGLRFVINAREGGFTPHFNTVSSYLTADY